VRCGYSPCLNGGNKYGARAVQCESSTCLHGEINALRVAVAGLLHAYMGNRPNLIPEMYSTIVYTEIIGDNNYYRYFSSVSLTM
jgi:hypothetical protein